MCGSWLGFALLFWSEFSSNFGWMPLNLHVGFCKFPLSLGEALRYLDANGRHDVHHRSTMASAERFGPGALLPPVGPQHLAGLRGPRMAGGSPGRVGMVVVVAGPWTDSIRGGGGGILWGLAWILEARSGRKTRDHTAPTGSPMPTIPLPVQ